MTTIRVSRIAMPTKLIIPSRSGFRRLPPRRISIRMSRTRPPYGAGKLGFDDTRDHLRDLVDKIAGDGKGMYKALKGGLPEGRTDEDDFLLDSHWPLTRWRVFAHVDDGRDDLRASGVPYLHRNR